jgi:hypothetical protein
MIRLILRCAFLDYYASKKGTLVHLFETPRKNREYRLLKCNCSPHFPDVCERGHSPQQSGLDNTGVNKFVSRKSGVVPTPQYTVPPAPVYSYAMYPQSAVYPPTPTYSYSAAPVQMVSQQRPVYSTPSSGLPVNVSNGLYMTEARGIFISNLSYTTTSNDLLLLLCRVAQPVEFKLHNDPKTNTFKGIATAQFATPELAMTVVQELNHKEHKGMLINVRLDKERTKVGQVPSPLIVNGSNYARVSTKRPYVSN